MTPFRIDLAAFRRPPADPIERTLHELERQGGALVRVAHVFATLMIVLFSLGSLVALSGDAVTQIAATLLHGGIPSIPKAISVVVSTLLVVCCDVGLVYAAMVIRALRTRGATDGYALHVAVLVTVSVIEAGTYLYECALGATRRLGVGVDRRAGRSRAVALGLPVDGDKAADHLARHPAPGGALPGHPAGA